MKNLLSLLFIIMAFSASAQVPNWVPAEPDSVKIGVLRNGVVNQVKMADLMRNRVSTTKYTADSTRNEAIYFHYKEGLISGGIVTLNTGMTLDVTAAIYSINNVIHYSTAGQITLNAADPSLPRVDVVAVNNLYQIVKITGTPSVNPIEPQLDPLTQVKLTSLYIAAGATSPAITQNIIYDENTEWTETTGGTITANANSTLRAIHGTKSVLISSFSSGSYVKFKTAGSAINVTDLSSLKFYFYLQSAWANSNNLSIQFYRNNVSVSNAPIIGVNKSAIGTWQTLAQGAFNFTGTSFDEVRFIFSGSSATQVSIDYVQAQGGIGGNPNTAAEVDPFYSANGATKAALNDTAAALRSAILSGGTSSGTVTSVAKGYGLVPGSPITTTGTNDVDSTVIASRARVNKVKDSLQANIDINTTSIATNTANIAANTTAISSNSTALTDSTSALRTAINLKLNKTDTAAMLTPYMRKTDTLTLSNRIAANTSAITANTTAIALKANQSALVDSSAALRSAIATSGGGGTTTTTTADSLKLSTLSVTGGAAIGNNFISNQTDNSYFYGASIEKGLYITSASINRWTSLVSSNLSTTEVNNAINSTTFQKRTTGDSSFIDRLPTIPTYNSATMRYLVIGGSNILNDMQFHLGTVPLATAISTAVDYANSTKGWPLSRIILSSPAMIGYNSTNSGANNDSLAYYASAAITAAKVKGIQTVDVFNYMKSYVASLPASSPYDFIYLDSIHPNNKGDSLIAVAFTYKIDNQLVKNSLVAGRNITAGNNISYGGVFTAPSITPNMKGILDWSTGTGQTATGIRLLNQSGYYSGLEYSTSTGYTVLNYRDLYFGGNRVASTVTTSNADAWFTGGNFRTRNLMYADGGISSTAFTYPTGTNTTGVINWGVSGSTVGIRPLNSTAAVSTGFTYKGSTGDSFLFGRGGFNLFFSTGTDDTNTTTSNTSFYIDLNNKLNVVKPVIFATNSTPATPATGTMAHWFDGTNFKVMYDNGTVDILATKH